MSNLPEGRSLSSEEIQIHLKWCAAVLLGAGVVILLNEHRKLSEEAFNTVYAPLTDAALDEIRKTTGFSNEKIDAIKESDRILHESGYYEGLAEADRAADCAELPLGVTEYIENDPEMGVFTSLSVCKVFPDGSVFPYSEVTVADGVNGELDQFGDYDLGPSVFGSILHAVQRIADKQREIGWQPSDFNYEK